MDSNYFECCFGFAPRDSVPGVIAKICKYLKDHPGWSEAELEAQIRQLVGQTGVASFNGRTGDVLLTNNDVNNLKISSAYFAGVNETVEGLNLVELYKQGIRFVFTNLNSATHGYDKSFVLDYVSDSGNVVYYPIASDSPVVSVNSMVGAVTIPVVDVSEIDSNNQFAKIFINESEDYPISPSYDSDKLGGNPPSYYASSESVTELYNGLATVAKSGSYNDLNDKPIIPTHLPNPNKLIMTGAVTAEYDGSTEVRVDIPSRYEPSIATPEMYGAVGDGVADDTQALQSAIDSGKIVMLTNRYKVSNVKLSPYVTMTSSTGGRIVDGKVMMCPYSSIVGVVFEVTSGNTNNCIIDIGTYDATGVAENGGDYRYTIRDVKVVTNFAVKSNLDFAYIHVGDGELANLYGVRITNVSIDGRLGKVFHFKAHLKENNIVDNGNGIWINTVSIDNVWCGVPEYIVYTDYDDPNNLKSQLGVSLIIGEVFMRQVTGEYSQYAKNDVFIGFPTKITASELGFIDKSYTQDGGDPNTAMYNIANQPWYNGAKTIINTDCMGDKFFAYAKLVNQNVAYINGSYTLNESTLYGTFLHDLSNNSYGLISSRTTDADVDPRYMTLNLVKNTNDSRTLAGVGFGSRMVFRENSSDGGTPFSLYFRSRPAVEYDGRVGCLYSDLYMPNGVSKAQLGDAYVPVIGSMVFNTTTIKPMWYTGEKWVYADGTTAEF